LNLPWLDYGLDFGSNPWRPEGGVSTPAARRRMDEALGRAAEAGGEAVRWFLLCDGRAGIVEERGLPRLQPRVLDDLDSAVRCLERHSLRGIFVLQDFSWFAAPRALRGVTMGGRRRLWTGAPAREALLEDVLRPIVARHGRSRGVLAWDVMNEPEWATLGVGAWNPATSLRRNTMRGLIADVLALVHRHSDRPATVGLASVAGLPLVSGLDLDFYQAHWYDGMEARAPLDAPVAALGLDRPLLLGEYPTRGSARTPAEIRDLARRHGWSGALAWSLLAEDAASDALACAGALAG
jgi:hypothetical protein